MPASKPGAKSGADAPKTAPASKRKKDSKKSESKAKRKRGGQPGNRNAVGNRGGAPYGNKNSVTHGLYEKITFKQLTPEEIALIEALPSDTRALMRCDLQLLCVREKRILARIAAMRESGDFRSALSSTRCAHIKRTEVKEESSSVECAAVIDQILRCEDHLLKITHEKMKILTALQTWSEKEERLQMQKDAVCEDNTDTVMVIYS
jgi:uncharacterized protein YjcR